MLLVGSQTADQKLKQVNKTVNELQKRLGDVCAKLLAYLSRLTFVALCCR